MRNNSTVKAVPLEDLDDEGVPEQLIAIVARATHPAKAERYRDADRLAHDLEKWLESQQLSLNRELVEAFFARHLT